MSKLKKNNADYFGHDADMRNNLKIRSLRKKFGNDGYAVWCYLLEMLTDSDDFELSFGDIDRELIAADFDVELSELEEITNYCIRIGLLQASEDGTRIFSSSQKERFDEMREKRNERAAIRREAGKKGSEKRWGYNQDDTEDNMDSKPIANDSKPIANDSQVKESKVNIKERDLKVSKEKFFVGFSPTPDRLEENSEKIPFSEVAEIWNSGKPKNLPSVTVLPDARRDKIRCRVAEMGGWPKARQTLEQLLAKVRESSFLRGDNGQQWKATFDWLFENGKNWVKVLEGNYDDNKGDSAQNTNGNGNGRQQSDYDKRRGTDFAASSSKDYKTTF